PRALASVLELPPPEDPASFVEVQHLDFRFMEGLADWFDRQTALKVRPLCDGDRPAAGTVLVAATRQHVVLSRDGSFRYTAEPRDALFRPSIDAFFSSCARRPTPDSTFLLLSGMSSDGAEGLLALREAGCHTIAQDASTSAVFGMPRAAISIGAARAVLGIGEIASELCARYGSHPLIV
ncbi:MAG: chemotaxis protein CheB, partial [Planctomycetota bacterium]